MAETVYGLSAIRCRSAILDARRRHSELLSQRGQSRYGSSEWNRLTAEIDANIRSLDQIENKHFGAKNG